MAPSETEEQVQLLQDQVQKYEFVIANLLAQLGGQATVPILKFKDWDGKLLNQIPVITVRMDTKEGVFELLLGSEMQPEDPGLRVSIPLVEARRFKEPMTFAQVADLLRADMRMLGDLEGDNRSLIGAHQDAAELIESDPCLLKAKPGEPMFVLLGRDHAAPHAILHWLHIRRETHNLLTPEQRQDAMRIGNAMMNYPGRKMPDDGYRGQFS